MESMLPNNSVVALARLGHLKHKMSRDTILHTMYTKIVNNYFDNGYAKEVAESDCGSKKYSTNLTTKSLTQTNRVVFYYAARCKGISLNSQLLQRPDLKNCLVGGILRIRQERIAIAADIEALFYQVRVTNKDKDNLLLLWWPDGDLDKSPKHYCTTIAIPSPSYTTYALKKSCKRQSFVFQ